MTTRMDGLFNDGPIPKTGGSLENPSFKKTIDAAEDFRKELKETGQEIIPELPAVDPTQRLCSFCSKAVDETSWFVTRVSVLQEKNSSRTPRIHVACFLNSLPEPKDYTEHDL